MLINERTTNDERRQQKRDDLTQVDVPEDCVGYITGRGGAVLRSLEEEWGTLMFFARSKEDQGRDEASGLNFSGRRPIGRSNRPDGSTTEKLAIFGPRRGRRGAELKVMSAVEHKKHGWFCDHKAAAFKLSLIHI